MKGSAGPHESKHGYRTRQLQNVPVGGADNSISSDHSFDTAKNFAKEAGVPKVSKTFSILSGFMRVVLALLTKTTSIEEVLHAIFWLLHRPEFAPLVHFTDTWPSNEAIWAMLMPLCQGRLGAFHFMKRLIDSLNPAHDNLNAARRDLPRKIFAYDDVAIKAVDRYDLRLHHVIYC